MAEQHEVYPDTQVLPDTQGLDNQGVIEVCCEEEPPPSSEVDRILSRGRKPFDVVLKGGAPWGFALNGGKGTDVPLHISKVNMNSRIFYNPFNRSFQSTFQFIQF